MKNLRPTAGQSRTQLHNEIITQIHKKFSIDNRPTVEETTLCKERKCTEETGENRMKNKNKIMETLA